jgi:hypothetical protein
MSSSKQENPEAAVSRVQPFLKPIVLGLQPLDGSLVLTSLVSMACVQRM